MELTEKERLMLVKKKGVICRATLKILNMKHDSKNSLEIKKNFQIILNELSTIASYSDSKNYDLNRFTIAVDLLFQMMSIERETGEWDCSPRTIETVCNYVNSIRFNFTRRDFKINIPKIDLSIFRLDSNQK